MNESDELKTYGAIILRNSVPFPMEQERFEERILALPLRVGLQESVSFVNELKKNSNLALVLVNQFSLSAVNPSRENMASVGVIANVNQIITLNCEGDPVYDLSCECHQRVNVQGMGLDNSGMFLATVSAIETPDVLIDVIPQTDLENYFALFDKLLAYPNLDIPISYSEESLDNREYPIVEMIQKSTYEKSHLPLAIRSFRKLSSVVDLVAAYLPISVVEKQCLLDLLDPVKRFELTRKMLRNLFSPV